MTFNAKLLLATYAKKVHGQLLQRLFPFLMSFPLTLPMPTFSQISADAFAIQVGFDMTLSAGDRIRSNRRQSSNNAGDISPLSRQWILDRAETILTKSTVRVTYGSVYDNIRVTYESHTSTYDYIRVENFRI